MADRDPESAAHIDKAALQPYTLEGVKETGFEVGRGSYASVYTVEYKGLTCAAKKLHQALYEYGYGQRKGYAARHFHEECSMLSQLRHPNIIQFLGVYNQPDCILPILVMEYLPMTLAQCVKRYGVLPGEISYSILNDVAHALTYLHQQNPPVIHRDLSANNVLLTSGLVAKVSDLGVAKLLDLSMSQMHTMTQTPGTQCYMPPEAMVENPHYNSKVDVFSYGVLMVHLFSGKWPFPKEAVKISGSEMIPQSEADRRQEKLDLIGSDHPLMNLILNCLNNNPTHRPEAVEILRQLSRVAAKFPSSAENKVELLQRANSLKAETERLKCAHEAEIRSLKTNTADIEAIQRAHDTEIQSLRDEKEKALQAKEEEKSLRADIERLQEAHVVEISSLKAESVKFQEERETEIESLRDELENATQTLQAEIKSLETQLKEALEEGQRMLEDAERCHSVEMKQHDLKLADTKDTLSSRTVEMETELRAARQQISFKDSKIRETEAEFGSLLQSKEALLSSKESLIVSKEGIISGLQEQLDHLRKSHTAQILQAKEKQIKLLEGKILVLQDSISALNTFPQGVKLVWKKCRDMPSYVSRAQAVLIRGIVYTGGGATRSDDDDYLIHRYRPTEDKWSTLPQAPVYWFGMGEVNEQLVLVGGKTRERVVTGKVYTFDNLSQKWKDSIPPMPTARCSPGVFSQPSCLTVIGGCSDAAHLSNVEIFIPQTSQWHEASPAPSPLSLMTSTVIHNKCFISKYDSQYIFQLLVSVLEDSAEGSSGQAIVEWKKLPNPPYLIYTLASISGCLLAVGGGEEKIHPTKAIHGYCPVTNTWSIVGELPEPRRDCITALLPSGELLVMGGREKLFMKKTWRLSMN